MEVADKIDIKKKKKKKTDKFHHLIKDNIKQVGNSQTYICMYIAYICNKNVVLNKLIYMYVIKMLIYMCFFIIFIHDYLCAFFQK